MKRAMPARSFRDMRRPARSSVQAGARRRPRRSNASPHYNCVHDASGGWYAWWSLVPLIYYKIKQVVCA